MPGALREDRASAAWELARAVAMTVWELRQRRRHAYWETQGTALPDTLQAPASRCGDRGPATVGVRRCTRTRRLLL
eukprot:3494658-Pyramimonas_sp.AAC.1